MAPQASSSIMTQFSHHIFGASKDRNDKALMAVLIMVGLIIVLTCDVSELTLAFVGAAVYGCLQVPNLRSTRSPAKAKGWKDQKVHKVDVNHSQGAWRPQRLHQGDAQPSRPRGRTMEATPPPKPEVRQASSMPIAPPKFDAKDWRGQVDELLAQIAPTAENDRAVERLAEFVQDKVRLLVPEAEVTGFASGDFSRGNAFGVAVPEVDIVVNISPEAIIARLHSRLTKGVGSAAQLEMRKLQKSAIRACTDLLVSKAGFKFRRSAFRGEEPKVTLLAPSTLGFSEQSIPVDFSVNSETPLYNAALLTECGQIDKRARALMLLVKRWAKDRGICHAAKGHLAPYAWSLLAIYFLQVEDQHGPMLPPLEGFKVSKGLSTANRQRAAAGEAATPGAWQPASAEDMAARPTAALFQEFTSFYARGIDWRKEAASVRVGRRGAPSLKLQLHIVVQDGGRSEVAPTIEDPFQPERNLGMSMNAEGLRRFKEEIGRADAMCNSGSSLAALLEPWVPPEGEQADDDEELRDSPARTPSPPLQSAKEKKETTIRVASSRTPSPPLTSSANTARVAAAPWRNRGVSTSTASRGVENAAQLAELVRGLPEKEQGRR